MPAAFVFGKLIPLAATVTATAALGTYLGQYQKPAWASVENPQRDCKLSPHVPTRDQQLSRLRLSSEEHPFDLLIIGGGATGTGCAVDAGTRGLRVALVDREDFASGTSSKSTKLVHGGVRYLEKAVFNLDPRQLKLVDEALRERHALLENAPHLCKSLPIITPCYSWWEVPYYWAGLKAYDLVAGFHGLGMSKLLTPREAFSAVPTLAETRHRSSPSSSPSSSSFNGSGGGGNGIFSFGSSAKKKMKAAVLYYDGQFDDARLNVTLAATASAAGAVTANYVEVAELIKNREGRVCGALVCDRLPPPPAPRLLSPSSPSTSFNPSSSSAAANGVDDTSLHRRLSSANLNEVPDAANCFEVYARAVVNAAGPFVDSIRALSRNTQNGQKDHPSSGGAPLQPHASPSLSPHPLSSAEAGGSKPALSAGKSAAAAATPGGSLAVDMTKVKTMEAEASAAKKAEGPNGNSGSAPTTPIRTAPEGAATTAGAVTVPSSPSDPSTSSSSSPTGSGSGSRSEEAVSGKKTDVGTDMTNMILPSLGAHVVLPAFYGSPTFGILQPSTEDGRVVFVLPWQGRLLAGTTDAPCPVISDRPRAASEEVDFILREVSRLLGVAVRPADVLSCWSGIRPLARDPMAKDTADAVRDHVVVEEEDGLISVSGGKWTTYRQMAEDTIDHVMATGRMPLHAASCRTKNLRLVGAHDYSRTMYVDLLQKYGRPGGALAVEEISSSSSSSSPSINNSISPGKVGGALGKREGALSSSSSSPSSSSSSSSSPAKSFATSPFTNLSNNLSAAAAAGLEMDEEVATHLSTAYGDRAERVIDIALRSGSGFRDRGEATTEGAAQKVAAMTTTSAAVAADDAAAASLGRRLVHGHPIIEAEVIYCMREEFSATAEDFLARRSRLAFLDAAAALRALPRVSA